MNLFSIPSLFSQDQGPPALLSVELPGIKVTGSDVSERGRTVWKTIKQKGSTLSNALPIDMKKHLLKIVLSISFYVFTSVTSPSCYR